MTRSTVTPWLAKKARLRSRKAVAPAFFSSGNLGIGEPRAVIDGDVERLPAPAALAALPAPVTPVAVADTIDAAELVGVDADHLARPLLLVTDDGRARIESGEPSEPEPAQHLPQRLERSQRLPGNGGPGQSLPTQPRDLGCGLVVQTARRASGRDERSRNPAPPLGGVAVTPFADGLRGNPHRACHLVHRSAPTKPIDDELSTMRCRSSILVSVPCEAPGPGL